MKQDKLIREAGPYKVESITQGGEGVRLVVYPAFPEYEMPGEDHRPWAVSRQQGDGGGPSIITVIVVATALEKFLNQPYSEAEVANWKAILEEALKPLRAKQQKRFARAMARKGLKDG